MLGGAVIFERVTYFVSQELDRIQTQHFPGSPPVEFHAAKIRRGEGFWRRVSEPNRDAVLAGLNQVIQNAVHPGLVLFAAVIEKNREPYDEEAVKAATDQICKRFDTFLARGFHEHNDPQRGLIVFAEGRFHQRGRIWVKGFRELGTRWGGLNNLSDIPYFASTRETRPLQIADFVAHATFLLYERRNPSLIRRILERFDQTGGVLHGLVHVPGQRFTCECPACYSRRNPGLLGPWV